MNIGVFGDSFAFEMIHGSYPQANNESWMHIIRKSGYKVKSYAMGGTSTWFSYKLFLRFYHHYDQIVFCYSSPNRIPNMPEGLESFSNFHGSEHQLNNSEIFQRLPDHTRNELLTILKVQPMMLDTQLNSFLVQNIFNSVNQICKQNNKPIVNILPFENMDSMDYSARTGDVFVDLLTVSCQEWPGLHKLGIPDPRYCHLSLENNLVLSRLITKSLESRRRNIVDTVNCGDFIYNKKITKRYEEMAYERKG